MAEEYYDYDDAPESRGRDHLFLWTVFILLLIGAAFACWIGSFYIFGHPEKPQPYKILKKMHKLEAPKRFEVTAAPPGEFLTAKKLFERYSNKKSLELAEENDLLLRNYIKNYKETKKLVPYITGRFEIIDAYELKATDVFGNGVTALGVSEETPQVLLEHVFTTGQENVAALKANLAPGLDMRLEKTRDLAAIIHIERTPDGHLQFTAMPLAYGYWAVKGSVGGFSLEPPSDLHLEGGLPIIRGQLFQNWMQGFAELQRRKPHANLEDGEKPPANEPELVRLDTLRPGAAVPETGALPDIPVATPIPAATPSFASRLAGGPKPTAAPKGHAGPTPMALALNVTPTPKPLAAATPMPVATPIAVSTPLPRESPSGVPLKSFFGSAPITSTAPSSGNWKTYAAGKLPPGRAVTSAEAGEMAERGETGERLYLRGNFVVTAAGEGRAVLRAQGGGSGESGKASGARVIVEYPGSIAPPAEGSTFARDEARGFEVRDVRRGADGQLNIWVREVTQPE